MDYKQEIIRQLRKGLAEMKKAHIALLAANPLWQQWAYLKMNQSEGMEWRGH